MRRWLLVLLFGALVAGIGVRYSLRPAPVLGAALDIGFRDLRRLQFDEENLAQDLAHVPETVAARLTFEGRKIEVLVRALPGRRGQPLNALELGVGEKIDVPYRQLILVRSLSPDAQVHQGQLTTLTLWEGDLGINGVAGGSYRLIVAPLTYFIHHGDGPVARRTERGAELSAESARHKIFRQVFSQHAALLPARGEEWSVWLAKDKEWVRWGSWPAGWPL